VGPEGVAPSSIDVRGRHVAVATRSPVGALRLARRSRGVKARPLLLELCSLAFFWTGAFHRSSVGPYRVERFRRSQVIYSHPRVPSRLRAQKCKKAASFFLGTAATILTRPSLHSLPLVIALAEDAAIRGGPAWLPRIGCFRRAGHRSAQGTPRPDRAQAQKFRATRPVGTNVTARWPSGILRTCRPGSGCASVLLPRSWQVEEGQEDRVPWSCPPPMGRANMLISLVFSSLRRSLK
jgi:hypothetical protein